MGPVIRKVRCQNKVLSVKLNELIGKSTKHGSFGTSIPYFSIPFESNMLFGGLVCKFTMADLHFFRPYFASPPRAKQAQNIHKICNVLR